MVLYIPGHPQVLGSFRGQQVVGDAQGFTYLVGPLGRMLPAKSNFVRESKAVNFLVCWTKLSSRIRPNSTQEPTQRVASPPSSRSCSPAPSERPPGLRPLRPSLPDALPTGPAHQRRGRADLMPLPEGLLPLHHRLWFLREFLCRDLRRNPYVVLKISPQQNEFDRQSRLRSSSSSLAGLSSMAPNPSSMPPLAIGGGAADETSWQRRDGS